jgi:aryl-alcohol dehydrogenase-like predicted oxidoreductase
MSLSPTHGHTTDEAGHKALAKALAIGATFWDTARVYGAGHNETLIGEFFAQNPGSREKVFIASKCGFQVRDMISRLICMQGLTVLRRDEWKDGCLTV